MKKLYIFAAFTAMLLLHFASAQAQTCQAFFQYSGTPALPMYSFTDSSTAANDSIISWAWDFGDGNTSTMQNPTHTYNTPGPWVVCLTVSTVLGCNSTYCDTVGTGGSGPTCTASLANTLSGNTATFTASGTSSGTPVSWYWDFGDGNTATTSSATTSHTYAGSNNYTACVVISYSDSCVATSCTSVNLGNSSGCQAGFFSYPDTSSQYSIIVVNTSTGNSLSCTWDFGDGNSSTNCYPSHTYSGPGTYVLCLTVTSGPACTSTYCDSITVTSKVNAPFSINVIPDTPTAIGEPLSSDLNIQMFPNPASTSVNFSADLAAEGGLEIGLYDVQGKQVRHIAQDGLNAGTHSLRLETADLPSGIYMARVKAGGQVAVKKLLITK